MQAVKAKRYFGEMVMQTSATETAEIHGKMVGLKMVLTYRH